MIEVRLNKSKHKIALIHHQEGKVVAHTSFPYEKAGKIVQRMFIDQGIYLGKVLVPLDPTQTAMVSTQIKRAYDTIEKHLQAQLTVEASYHEPSKKWVIKGCNPANKEFYVLAEVYNSFLVELKQTKRVNFSDKSFVLLNHEQVRELVDKMEAVKRTVMEMNKPITTEKYWLRETVVVV